MSCQFESIIKEPKKISKIKPQVLDALIGQATSQFRAEFNLLKIKAESVVFVGDTHGDFDTTLNIVEYFFDNDIEKIIFIGDYVDRGPKQLENVVYLYALKVCYPTKVFLLRGNHETPLANAYYGFKDIMIELGLEPYYDKFNKSFGFIPVAAIVNDVFFVVHGGIASKLNDVEQINAIPRPDDVWSANIVMELLWNDPREDISGFVPSYRGPGIYFFGRDVFEEFMQKNGLEKMIRAHEVFLEGYHYYFDKQILSLFSSKNYVGRKIDAKIGKLEGDKLTVVPLR
ncbi:MAG: metallophosphoesterase [Candidatus Odinarchaeota archaeon]|nr:metallophosphoesterase [Candidatus Odinarchaeota archaeon]